MMGLIGGGPTFVGTAVGSQFTSDAMSVIFLTLAAGSLSLRDHPAARSGVQGGQEGPDLLGRPARAVRGFVTDMVVTAGGA
jgi:ZIP family zinc transporter